MSKVVSLSRRYTIGSADFDRLEFREPKLADYRKHGKVFEWQRDVFVTYPDAIWGHADALLQGVPTGALGELDLIDALAVEQCVTGFFLEATVAFQKRSNLSSGSAGDRTTSTT